MFMALLLLLAGCSELVPQTGPQRSRIYLDSFTKTPEGLVISNFSPGDVDSFVRFYAEDKGYEVRFAGETDTLVQQELSGDDASLLWVAEKKGGPSMLFISTDRRLIVTFVKPGGSEYAQVLYRVLRDKFGERNVHLID